MEQEISIGQFADIARELKWSRRDVEEYFENNPQNVPRRYLDLLTLTPDDVVLREMLESFNKNRDLRVLMVTEHFPFRDYDVSSFSNLRELYRAEHFYDLPLFRDVGEKNFLEISTILTHKQPDFAQHMNIDYEIPDAHIGTRDGFNRLTSIISIFLYRDTIYAGITSDSDIQCVRELPQSKFYSKIVNSSMYHIPRNGSVSQNISLRIRKEPRYQDIRLHANIFNRDYFFFEAIPSEEVEEIFTEEGEEVGVLRDYING